MPTYEIKANFEIEAETQEEAEDLFHSLDTGEPEFLYFHITGIKELDA
jgi:hypothetical protein